MRLPILLATTLVAATATGQNYFVPDNNAAAGSCNVIPFGSSSLATWGNQKYQSKATPTDLGSMAGLVTGLGYAPCGTGTIHFDAIEIILDHHPAGTPLDPTFANNLTPNAVTVLSATDFTWNITANTWNEIGLQNFFVYNGVDDMVMQITCTNSLTTGTTGFRRDTRQRLYWYGTTGPAPASGTTGNAAMKFDVSELTARLSTYGVGCAGTMGTSAHHLTGSSQLGQTTGLDVSNGLPNGLAVSILGFYNAFPFPLDLSVYGAPGCFQYEDITASSFMLLDGAGGGSVAFPIPNNPAYVGVLVFSQYACLDPLANAPGITTTNYGRIYIGN
mgnify:CR=1 FL=1